ncbi:uncharacterized protein LOC132742438 [Ruditapes philippinarum]|uniref:uncharacterized protein LOC132742438 n=1 Tax=Ruditapes philippinarum TaxID=129788 RepID=UPI00295A6276|nr:uncharacterized protein LOC132742438 [Ruditapes philippinarum]
MTARQQSLSAKVPRYVALFFPKDKTTAIVPTDNIQTETFKDKDVITVNFNDENLSAEIILMSNSRATLTDSLEEFVPSTSETTEIQEADLISNKKSKKALKKKTDVSIFTYVVS